MKKIILLIAIIIQISFIFSAPNYKDFIDDKVGIEKYPNASAVNIYTEVNLSINADYSYSYNVFYVKKILTYKGKKRYSDVKFEYNKDYENIELGDCFTVNSTGERVEIPEEAFHDSEHYSTLFSPEYINQWEKIVNFPEIEPGNYIVVNYTRNNTRKTFVSGIEHLMEENPYIEKRFTVTYPENVKMYVKSLKELDNLKIFKSEKNGIVTEKFVIQNAAQIKSEKNAPSYVYTGCPILYSNDNSWKVLGKKIFDRFNSNIKITDLINETAKKITANCSSEKEKIFAIYDYFARNYTIKHSNFMDLDFKPTALEKTFEKKYGSQRDIVALFLGMTKSVGIKKCYPAFHLDRSLRFGDIEKKNVLLDFVGNIYVYWNDILIAPANDSMPFGYAGVNECNLVIGKNKPVFKKYKCEKLSLIKKEVICKSTRNNEYINNYNVEFSGAKDSRYRSQFRNSTAEKTKIWFGSQQSDKSSILTDGPTFSHLDDLNENVKLAYSNNVKGFLTQQDKYLYFSLPLEKVNINVGAKNRELPYLIYRGSVIEEEFIIEDVPTNFTVIKPKENFKNSFKFGKQKILYEIEIKQKNGNLVFKRSVNIPEGIISVEDYTDFRNFVNNLNNPTNNMIFLMKK